MSRKKIIKILIVVVVWIGVSVGVSRLFNAIRSRFIPVEVFGQRGDPKILASVPRSEISQDRSWKPLEGPCGSGDPQRGETSVFAVTTPKGHLFYALSEYQLFRLGEAAGDTKFIGQQFSGSPVLRMKVLFLADGRHELFAMTNKGLFKSEDQGDNWKEVTPQNAVPALQSFAVINGDRGAIITLVSRREVFISNDSGATWNSVTGSTSDEGSYHDVEVLVRNGQPIIFLAGKNGLVRTEWPAGHLEVVKQFKGDSIQNISKTMTADSTNQVLDVNVAAWSGLLSYVSSPRFWHTQDLGATWEEVSVPYLDTNYYPSLQIKLFNVPNATKTTAVPLTSGKYLLSRNGEANWSFLQLSGVEINPEYLRAPIGGIGESVIYGLSKAGHLLEINLEHKLWREVRISLPTLSVRKLAVSPKTSGERVWLAATEAEVFTSKDEGLTWNSLGHVPAETQITTVSISPNFEADQTLHVGTHDGLYTYDFPNKTWKKNESLSSQKITTIYFSSSFSVDNSVFLGSNVGIFVSRDRGAQWSHITNDIGEIPVNEISGAPNGNVYAATRRGLYSSRDKGNSWQQLGNYLASKNVLSLAVGTIDQSEKLIVAGTVDGAFSSWDNGATWEHLNLPTGSFSVSSVLVVRDPNDNFVVYLGTVGGGLVSSEDSGKTWTEMAVAERGLQVWDLEVAQENPIVLLAGTLNRSVWIYRGRNS
jgi:photosystem II stability/assembly factor-like uncharacterized protein